MTYQAPTKPDRDGAGGGLKLVFGLLALMWLLEIVDLPLGGMLDNLGIRPRDPEGLVGVVAAPFLHAGFGHLISNTIPFAVLGAMIAVSGALRVLSVTVCVGLVSGLGVWFVSPPNSITVGASGLVFGFAAYLITRGVFTRSIAQLVVGLAVVVIWGGTLLTGLLPQAFVSWQAHGFGAIGGVLAAWLTARRDRSERSTPRPAPDPYGYR